MFERDLLRQMGAASSWGILAEVDGEIAGHAAFVPASASGVPVDDPQLAHLWQLFVAPPYWGAGVATTLHDAAVRAAAGRGFTHMRLVTPADHGRARRFYEREGWTFADRGATCRSASRSSSTADRSASRAPDRRRRRSRVATRPARCRSAGSPPRWSRPPVKA